MLQPDPPTGLAVSETGCAVDDRSAAFLEPVAKIGHKRARGAGFPPAGAAGVMDSTMRVGIAGLGTVGASVIRLLRTRSAPKA